MKESIAHSLSGVTGLELYEEIGGRAIAQSAETACRISMPCDPIRRERGLLLGECQARHGQGGVLRWELEDEVSR